MKKFLYRCRYVETSNGFFISGKLIHWTVLLPIGLWVNLVLPFFLGSGFTVLIVTLLVAIFLTLILLYSFNFIIRIDSRIVQVKLRIGFIPFKVIKSSLSDLIIDHQDAKHLEIISQRNDYYKTDNNDNLRFSYITPWDGDIDVFYIDYKNKEVDFNTYCDDFVWYNLIKGLKKLKSNKH